MSTLSQSIVKCPYEIQKKIMDLAIESFVEEKAREKHSGNMEGVLWDIRSLGIHIWMTETGPFDSMHEFWASEQESLRVAAEMNNVPVHKTPFGDFVERTLFIEGIVDE